MFYVLVRITQKIGDFSIFSLAFSPERIQE